MKQICFTIGWRSIDYKSWIQYYFKIAVKNSTTIPQCFLPCADDRQEVLIKTKVRIQLWWALCTTVKHDQWECKHSQTVHRWPFFLKISSTQSMTKLPPLSLEYHVSRWYRFKALSTMVIRYFSVIKNS